jgi:GT2 family glycosyltransferase
VDHCEALEIGVEASNGPLLAFLSPRVHGLGKTWLVDLLAALGEGGAPSAVSPTLLYEDGSVRYAGIDAVQFTESAPYGAAVCSRAGYPRGALPRNDGQTLACAIECCAMTRSAFESVGGFSQGYASDSFKGIDLFLRMADSGVRMSWTAAAELYALDDLQAASDSTVQVAKLVDGWSFRAAWQARTSAQSPEAANDSTSAGPVVALPDVTRARVRAAVG